MRSGGRPSVAAQARPPKRGRPSVDVLGCTRLVGWLESTHRTGLSVALSPAQVWRLRLLGARLPATCCRAPRIERSACDAEAAEPATTTSACVRDSAALLPCPISLA